MQFQENHGFWIGKCWQAIKNCNTLKIAARKTKIEWALESEYRQQNKLSERQLDFVKNSFQESISKKKKKPRRRHASPPSTYHDGNDHWHHKYGDGDAAIGVGSIVEGVGNVLAELDVFD